MAALPGIIRIAGIEYAVNLVEALTDGDKRCFGVLSHKTTEIKLDAGLSDGAAYQTLWHEIVHVLTVTGNADITEGQVEALAWGIVQVIRDNPGLCK